MLAGGVSNKDVRGRIALTLLLLLSSLLAQKSKVETKTTIDRAKQAIISNFDPALPNLTLESFLKYETGDIKIDWRISGCEDIYSEPKLVPGDGRCVTAYSSLRDSRVITVCIRIPDAVSVAATLISVFVIAKGLQSPIRLIEVPAVVQGAKPPGLPRWAPRDLFPLSRPA